MRCENKTFLQNDPGFLQEISSTAVEVGLARTLLVSAAFLGLLAVPGAPRASAENYDSCQRRIAKADHKLHEAVEHHGWDSRQADRARHQVHEARENCWN